MVTVVTLHDGREVSNTSREWREECEARYLLNLPSKDVRREYLLGVQKKRGHKARARLEILATKIHEARKRDEGTAGTPELVLRAYLCNDSGR